MKVIERIAYSPIRQVVTINWSNLGGLYADTLVIIAPWKNVSVDG